jgi:hypothetical protein
MMDIPVFTHCQARGRPLISLTYRFFVAIINHRKNSKAIDKANQYRVVHGKQVKKRTTAGWQFDLEWKDGTTSWLPVTKRNKPSGSGQLCYR